MVNGVMLYCVRGKFTSSNDYIKTIDFRSLRKIQIRCKDSAGNKNNVSRFGDMCTGRLLPYKPALWEH